MKNGKWIWEQVALPLVSLLIGGIVGYFASQQAMQKQISVSGENIAALQIQQTSTEARIASLSQKFEGVDQAIGVVENLKERVERVSTSVDETLSKWSRADEKVTELENNSTVLVGRIKGVDPIVAKLIALPNDKLTALQSLLENPDLLAIKSDVTTIKHDIAEREIAMCDAWVSVSGQAVTEQNKVVNYSGFGVKAVENTSPGNFKVTFDREMPRGYMVVASSRTGHTIGFGRDRAYINVGTSKNNKDENGDFSLLVFLADVSKQ